MATTKAEATKKAAARTRGYSENWLASLAECHSPDNRESAGTVFLRHVAEAVAEQIDDGQDLAADDLSDTISEIADGAPDVYTHQRWLEFVDLCAYEEDISELAGAEADLTKLAGYALYQIADRLARALFEEARVEIADADDG
ncbi:MAG: hypothetical protein ACREN4_09415 [Candidatus Dormibacteria bacterium]